MPVVCPVADRRSIAAGSKVRTRIPTELLGKTSSRLYWLAVVVMVSTVAQFVVRHFLDPNFRAIETRRLASFGSLVASFLFTGDGLDPPPRFFVPPEFWNWGWRTKLSSLLD